MKIAPYQSCRFNGYRSHYVPTRVLVVCMLGASAAWAQESRGRAPLGLVEVLSTVLTRHPLVEAAVARTRAASAARITAGLPVNPMLTYQVDNGAVANSAAAGFQRDVMTTLALPLQSIYQRLPLVHRADAVVRATTAEAADTRQQLGLQATRAYYRVALSQESVAVARDLTRWLDTVVAYNQARVREGVAAEAELLRAQIELDRVRADAALQEADLAGARVVLGAFLQTADRPRDPLVVVGAAELLRVPVAAGTGATAAPDSGWLGRPDLLGLRERAAAARAAVSSERTMIVRELGAMIGRRQMGGSTSLVAGISLPVPLFDQNIGEIARARAESDAEALELVAAERAAGTQIAGAREVARVLAERAQALASGDASGFLARADESRRIALGAYREGGASLLQVLDAARAWGDARLMFFRLLYAQHESVLTLLVAEGNDLARLLPVLGAAGAPGSPR